MLTNNIVSFEQLGPDEHEFFCHLFLRENLVMCLYFSETTFTDRTDDEFRFKDASTYASHLRQNGMLTWFGFEWL